MAVEGRLTGNPFNILRVSPRASARELAEACEERALEGDPQDAQAARATLTQPKNRLAAEVRWLPELSPSRARSLMQTLGAPDNEAFDLDGIPPLARANVACELLTVGRLTPSEALPVLVAAFAAVRVPVLFGVLNEERAFAGMPLIPDEDVLSAALRTRLEEVADVMVTALNDDDGAVVLADVLEAEANGDQEELPEFLRLVTDRYAVPARRHLEQREGRVRRAIGVLRRAAGAPSVTAAELALAVKGLENAVHSWDRVAQPLQLLARNTGQAHDESIALAREVRQLAVDLNNDHSRSPEALALSRLLADAFQEVPQVAELVQHDVETLEDLIARNQAGNQFKGLLEPAKRVRDAVGTLQAAVASVADNDEVKKHVRFLANALADWQLWVTDLDGERAAAAATVSTALATQVRNLAVEVANEHQELTLAKVLTELIRRHLGNVGDVALTADEDMKTLDRLIVQRREAEAREAEQQRSQRLDLTIGSDRLVMNPDEIWYQGRRLKTAAIDRVRWGVYKHYVNGIRISRAFTVWLGTSHSTIQIECVRAFDREAVVSERMGQIVERIWPLVGYRLWGQILEDLSRGRQLDFGGTKVTKDGVSLTRSKWFRMEPYFGQWTDLSYRSQGGNLWISSVSEPAASANLGYRDVDNVHILEAVLGFLWKDGNHAKLARGEFKD